MAERKKKKPDRRCRKRTNKKKKTGRERSRKNKETNGDAWMGGPLEISICGGEFESGRTVPGGTVKRRATGKIRNGNENGVK